MKKAFAIFTTLTVLALVFASCKLPLENNDDSGETPKLPSLTIKNESSYDLKDVTFSGVTFATDGKVLKKSTNSARAFNAKASGYITFVRNDIGIACRTADVVTIDSDDKNFIFLDSTVVEEVGNRDNKKTLAQITFISQLRIEHGGLNVVRNDAVNMGEAVFGFTPKQTEFTLKNTGAGKLLLNGNEPVKISGADVSGVFAVVQPASSEIAPNDSLSFKINFSPEAAQVYNGTVTVSTNDLSGDFSFIIKANGVEPKPVISIWNGTTEISQNGTVNMGEVIITRSGSIDIVIKNSGYEVLNIQNTQITITGENPELFSIGSPPSANISPNEQSLFTVRFTPTGAGEKRATITIPSNDTSRPNALFFVQASGKREYPIIEIKNGNVPIVNDTIDLGNVELDTTELLTLTLNNTGKVDLTLTGSPVLDINGSPAFTMPAQVSRTTIEPNDPVSFTVRFSPLVEGIQEVTIGIACNTQAGYFSFKIKGTGHIKRPQIQVQSGSSVVNSGNGTVSFGNVHPAATNNGPIAFGNDRPQITKTMNFTIKNIGDADLNLTGSPAVVITGINANSFTVTRQPATTLAPNATTDFIVRFDPAAENIYEAQVTIVSDSRTNSSFTFKLSGTGINMVVFFDDAEGEMKNYSQRLGFAGYYSSNGSQLPVPSQGARYIFPPKRGSKSIAIGGTYDDYSRLHLNVNLARKAKLSFWYANKYAGAFSGNARVMINKDSNMEATQTWSSDVEWSFIEFDLKPGQNEIIWRKGDGTNYMDPSDLYFLSLDDILIYYTE